MSVQMQTVQQDVLKWHRPGTTHINGISSVYGNPPINGMVDLLPGGGYGNPQGVDLNLASSGIMFPDKFREVSELPSFVRVSDEGLDPDAAPLQASDSVVVPTAVAVTESAPEPYNSGCQVAVSATEPEPVSQSVSVEKVKVTFKTQVGNIVCKYNSVIINEPLVILVSSDTDQFEPATPEGDNDMQFTMLIDDGRSVRTVVATHSGVVFDYSGRRFLVMVT